MSEKISLDSSGLRHKIKELYSPRFKVFLNIHLTDSDLRDTYIQYSVNSNVIV